MMAGEKFTETKNYFPRVQYTRWLQLCGLHTYFSITLIYKWTSLFSGSDHCHVLVVYLLILDHFKCYWVLNVVTLVDKDASCQLLIQQNRSTLGSVVSLAMSCDGMMQKVPTS